MLICGLKLTHDGGIALLEDSRLRASIELEKIANNPRYQYVDRWEVVEDLFDLLGIRVSEVDQFVVDGWLPRPGQDNSVLQIMRHGEPTMIEVAPYQETSETPTPLRRFAFDGLPLGSGWYASYHHSTQHVLGSYCTSRFAAAGEPSLAMVWDGGMPPTLYHVGGNPIEVTLLGTLMPLYGFVFAQFCGYFEPFRSPDVERDINAVHASPGNLEVAGKAMAYAALGRDDADVYPVIRSALARIPFSVTSGVELAEQLAKRRPEFWPDATDADLIATLQGYLGHELLAGLHAQLERHGLRRPNLCLAGGCALNIKWNSLFRSSGLFNEVWIPPFPNDSGAALGTAVCEMVRLGGTQLSWDLYSGPALSEPGDVPGWRVEPCDEAGLARVLHFEGKPVVVLSGRAELGPRALGNRSILAPAVDPAMKHQLNVVKDRAYYRPVAPVCLEDRAPEIFSPGIPDRYMLFDHRVRPEWVDRVPAIMHLDGTARLQTVGSDDHPILHRILVEYDRLSGIPVLCNTSANHKGRGFFPDVRSAAEWGRLDTIWSEGLLYRRG